MSTIMTHDEIQLLHLAQKDFGSLVPTAMSREGYSSATLASAIRREYGKMPPKMERIVDLLERHPNLNLSTPSKRRAAK
ncbi:MAG: hypothetical protein KKB70_06270 [Proteobacteria bacterium]|nr:hypothetical protein [Pseudomonadota bacterium]